MYVYKLSARRRRGRRRLSFVVRTYITFAWVNVSAISHWECFVVVISVCLVEYVAMRKIQIQKLKCNAVRWPSNICRDHKCPFRYHRSRIHSTILRRCSKIMERRKIHKHFIRCRNNVVHTFKLCQSRSYFTNKIHRRRSTVTRCIHIQSVRRLT